jgi:hypothetical protein
VSEHTNEHAIRFVPFTYNVQFAAFLDFLHLEIVRDSSGPEQLWLVEQVTGCSELAARVETKFEQPFDSFRIYTKRSRVFVVSRRFKAFRGSEMCFA